MNRAREAAEKIVNIDLKIPAATLDLDGDVGKSTVEILTDEVTNIIESTCIAPIAREVEGLVVTEELKPGFAGEVHYTASRIRNKVIRDILTIINSPSPDKLWEAAEAVLPDLKGLYLELEYLSTSPENSDILKGLQQKTDALRAALGKDVKP